MQWSFVGDNMPSRKVKRLKEALYGEGRGATVIGNMSNMYLNVSSGAKKDQSSMRSTELGVTHVR